MILAGDVGGTKVNLALCEVQSAGTVKTHRLQRYSSAEFSGLPEIVTKYLNENADAKVTSACFGVPGAVIHGRCQTVNLPWVLDERELEQRLKIYPVRLINDLQATAYGLAQFRNGHGIEAIRSAQDVVSSDGKANQALLAPGTGLGEALLTWSPTENRHIVSASEGGHTEFGPQDEEQLELLRWLWTRHKHVSVEHVGSGPGIYRIYRFLIETGRAEETDQTFAQYIKSPDADPPQLITTAAMTGKSELCQRVMDLWLFAVGAEAGNLALKTLSFGGVFIGGGIIPKILPLFQRPAFLAGFENKGRMSALMRSMPVYAVTDPHAAIYGSALYATL